MGCSSSQPPEGDWAPDDVAMARDESDIAGKVEYKVGDRLFIEMQKFPIVVLDTTGSMAFETVSTSSTILKKDLAKEILRSCVARLLKLTDFSEPTMIDGREIKVASGLPIGPGGPIMPSAPQQVTRTGVHVITFNGTDGARDMFFTDGNFDVLWETITWRGQTIIMDGWRLMLKTYQDRFAVKSDVMHPLLLGMIITDGVLRDGREFEQHLKASRGREFFEVAVVGHGKDHDEACDHYKEIARVNPHVRFSPFTGVEDADVVVDQLVSMINPRLIMTTSLRGAT